ncbi:EamA family transporter [Bacteroides coprosuis]|uniref:EamA family transporter n=1 Tax=Bacteroides coprosuis TaxID=151276 RepID=UPI001D3A2D82|nr:DMT family transporter [Bacteroides coprosuis]HJD92478.1 DMT family transporter [Bacteroides coprosuis]
MRKPSPATAIPAVLLSMISVQSGASIAKRLFPVLGASGTSTLRIGLSAILLFLVNKPKLFSLTKQQWMYSISYGLFLGGMNLLFYCGIERIPLGLGVTVEFVGPLTLALVSSRKLQDLLWALLACMGILLIVPWNNNGIDPIGLLFTLSAGACLAAYIVMGGKISKIMNNGDAVSIGMCVATLFILPFGIFSGELAHVTWVYFIMRLGVAIFSSSIPFTLDFIGLKYLPAKTFSILMSLHPVFAALFGLLFLSEFLEINQWISILCIVTASIGSTLSAHKYSKHHKVA